MILFIGNVLGLQIFRGQQLSAVVATLYKFKLGKGWAVFMPSLMTPKAWP